MFWPGVTRKPDGIGMGLTVASELVDGRGGKMRTVVPGELGGATFEFDLPLAAGTDRRGSPMTPLRVLIVDDDAELRQALGATLEEEEGWEIRGRNFGDVADALERFRPDMLVLDLVEGQGADGRPTGNEAFQEIRAQWFCPVVVYSAFPNRQGFDHALATTVQKGTDTELHVRNRLREYVSHAEMIRSVHEDFDTRVRGSATGFRGGAWAATDGDRRRP